MQTLTLFSIIINIGLITLCLSLVYPKAIQRYTNNKKRREKQREIKETQFIRRIVDNYLNELRND